MNQIKIEKRLLLFTEDGQLKTEDKSFLRFWLLLIALEVRLFILIRNGKRQIGVDSGEFPQPLLKKERF